MKKALEFSKRGLKVGGIKLTAHKMAFMAFMKHDDDLDLTYGERTAGVLQLSGFVRVAPKWFLNKYRIKCLKKEDSDSDSLDIFKDLLKYENDEFGSSVYHLLTHLKNKPSNYVAKVKDFFHPYLYLVKEKKTSEKAPQKKLKNSEYYRQKLEKASLPFSRKKIKMMQRFGQSVSDSPEKKFRMLAATHLICGFLRTLSGWQFKRWVDVESEKEVLKKKDGKRSPYKSFRRFCRRKQEQLAVELVQLVRNRPSLKTIMKVLYGPAIGFTGKYTFEEARVKLEKLNKKHSGPLFQGQEKGKKSSSSTK